MEGWRQRQPGQRENLVYEKSYKSKNYERKKTFLTETGLLMEGVIATLRLSFDFSGLNEWYGEIYR